MSTLIEHYTLEDGKEWAVLADGGSTYESIQPYVCVPAGDLGMPAEELGKAVASLRFAAEATRLKCAWLNRMMPHHEESIPMLETINRNLEEASRFSKESADSLLEATPQQIAFPTSIRPYSRDEENAVLRMMSWHPMVGLNVLLDMKQEIEGKLREEYFDLLRLRESRPKKRLTPRQTSRLAQVTKALNGCGLCGLIDGNHTDVCRAMRVRPA